jgi:predicted transglutaminase-like cysteine proteinase
MKTKQVLNSAIAAIVIGTQATAAFASPAGMKTLARANPPIGHYEFCQQYADQCIANTADESPMRLTESNWKVILTANFQANSAVEPATDEEIYGVEERWTLPSSAGDCEDYALLKRKLLMDNGFSPSNLLVTVVLQASGAGHAVLTVRTDRGDFVLDNLRNKCAAMVRDRIYIP